MQKGVNITVYSWVGLEPTGEVSLVCQLPRSSHTSRLNHSRTKTIILTPQNYGTTTRPVGAAGV